MQNATDLAKFPYKAPSEIEEIKENEEEKSVGAKDPFVVQMTTNYLQSNQTDFHILPSCNATFCVASGTYINDDGYTLDLTDRNTYTFNY